MFHHLDNSYPLVEKYLCLSFSTCPPDLLQFRVGVAYHHSYYPFPEVHSSELCSHVPRGEIAAYLTETRLQGVWNCKFFLVSCVVVVCDCSVETCCCLSPPSTSLSPYSQRDQVLCLQSDGPVMAVSVSGCGQYQERCHCSTPRDG